jgi:uncharacterized membrane protein
MTAWYLPITIIPGIGMLILSTVTQMLSISEEIRQFSLQECSEFQHQIANRKIKQLGLLTKANSLLYLATGSFVLSGILGIIIENDSVFSFPSIVLYTGAIFIFIAIDLLILYSFRAIKIRKDQFTHSNKH